MAETNIPADASAAGNPTDDDIDLLDLLQVVADNLRLLILVPLLAGLLALGITFLIKPTFTATTKFMPPLPGQGSAQMMLQSLGALGGLAGAAAGIKNPNDQFIAFLASESVSNALIARFKLKERYDVEFNYKAQKELGDLSKFISGKDGLITVEVDDHDPVFAATLANAYMEELSNLLKRLAITEAQYRRVFFEKQLADTKDKLSAAEQAIRASGVNSSVLRQNPEASIRVVAELQARIAAQQIKLTTLRGFLTESAPDFKQAQIEIGALRAQLAKAEASTAPGSNEGDANYIARYRDVKYFESLFDFFARQYEAAKTDEAREGTTIQVVDPALPPERKSKPKRGAIAALTALSVGILMLLFVFFRQSVRGAAQTPESAAKMSRLRRSWAKAFGRA